MNALFVKTCGGCPLLKADECGYTTCMHPDMLQTRPRDRHISAHCQPPSWCPLHKGPLMIALEPVSGQSGP